MTDTGHARLLFEDDVCIAIAAVACQGAVPKLELLLWFDAFLGGLPGTVDFLQRLGSGSPPLPSVLCVDEAVALLTPACGCRERIRDALVRAEAGGPLITSRRVGGQYTLTRRGAPAVRTAMETCRELLAADGDLALPEVHVDAPWERASLHLASLVPLRAVFRRALPLEGGDVVVASLHDAVDALNPDSGVVGGPYCAWVEARVTHPLPRDVIVSGPEPALVLRTLGRVWPKWGTQGGAARRSRRMPHVRDILAGHFRPLGASLDPLGDLNEALATPGLRGFFEWCLMV